MFVVIREKKFNRMMYDCDYKKYHNKTKFIEYVLNIHLKIEIIFEIFEKKIVNRDIYNIDNE